MYRRKIILALIESFGGKLCATDFQKLLFIFSDRQVDRRYSFVPYKYGCFSFQAMADKNKLVYEGYLENSKSWILKNGNSSFKDALNGTDNKLLNEVTDQFQNFSTGDLIRYVYLNYPYYAINSCITEKWLSLKERERINRHRPVNKIPTLFTIGYEGQSIEEYLNALINNNIKILCDVRKNALSRKYGFSKKTLEKTCNAVNIEYIHIPELGIVSQKRENLHTQEDYAVLFSEYEGTVLVQQGNHLKFIHNLLIEYSRVALTCFEASPRQCHRTRVANSVHSMGRDIPLIHLQNTKEY